MPELPLAYLTHTTSIEPYLGPDPWTGFGPAFEAPCLVVQHTVGRLQRGGKPIQAEANIYYPVETEVPKGSRIRIPDGRLGYAAEVVRHEAGGLPTPDHVEVIWRAESIAAAPAAEAVTLLRRALKDTKDGYGNDLYETTEIVIPGCQIEFIASAEDADGQVSSRIAVTMPPGSEPTAVDKLRARELVYEIEGDPEVESSPLTGLESAVQVRARRVH